MVVFLVVHARVATRPLWPSRNSAELLLETKQNLFPLPIVQRTDIAAVRGIAPAMTPARVRSLILRIGPERLNHRPGPGGSSEGASAMSGGGSTGPRKASVKT